MIITRTLTDRFQLPRTPSAPRTARARVAAVCRELGADEAAVAVLLTSELTTNAVLHPKRVVGVAEPAILVRISLTDKVLRVEVSDHDPRPLPPLRGPASPSESGAGLHLVAQLSTAWGSYSPEPEQGKVVWFEMATNTHGSLLGPGRASPGGNPGGGM